jgi:hypothetical protein
MICGRGTLSDVVVGGRRLTISLAGFDWTLRNGSKDVLDDEADGAPRSPPLLVGGQNCRGGLSVASDGFGIACCGFAMSWVVGILPVFGSCNAVSAEGVLVEGLFRVDVNGPRPVVAGGEG